MREKLAIVGRHGAKQAQQSAFAGSANKTIWQVEQASICDGCPLVFCFLDLELGANMTPPVSRSRCRCHDLPPGRPDDLIHMVGGPLGTIWRVKGACEVTSQRMSLGPSAFGRRPPSRSEGWISAADFWQQTHRVVGTRKLYYVHLHLCSPLEYEWILVVEVSYLWPRTRAIAGRVAHINWTTTAQSGSTVLALHTSP